MKAVPRPFMRLLLLVVIGIFLQRVVQQTSTKYGHSHRRTEGAHVTTRPVSFTVQIY